MEDLINCFLYEPNCRNDFYRSYEIRRNIDRKKICGYLKKLEKNGDDYKIKHIKKMYRIYNILHQIISLIYNKDTFEYTDKSLYIDDFSNFLTYVIDCIKGDIIHFIDMIQDNEEFSRTKLDKNQEEFSIYLKFKHFYVN